MVSDPNSHATEKGKKKKPQTKTQVTQTDPGEHTFSTPQMAINSNLSSSQGHQWLHDK